MIFFEGSGELSDDGWDFDSAQEDSFLPLELNILWPSDEPGEVSLRLDGVSNSIVSGSLLKEGVSLLFDFLTSSLFSLCSFSLGLGIWVPLVLVDLY